MGDGEELLGESKINRASEEDRVFGKHQAEKVTIIVTRKVENGSQSTTQGSR